MKRYYDALERAVVKDGVLIFPDDYPIDFPPGVREGVDAKDRTVEEVMAIRGVSRSEAEYFLALERGEAEEFIQISRPSVAAD